MKYNARASISRINNCLKKLENMYDTTDSKKEKEEIENSLEKIVKQLEDDIKAIRSKLFNSNIKITFK